MPARRRPRSAFAVLDIDLREIGLHALGPDRVIFHALVENGDILKRDQVYHRHLVGNDFLEGIELLLARLARWSRRRPLRAACPPPGSRSGWRSKMAGRA